ncbi:MAG: hypothetical protein PHF14_09250 [Verrucomicrobiota bacterium]|nr:hypothetical protein [Verrucomicrobiota bacterium]
MCMRATHRFGGGSVENGLNVNDPHRISRSIDPDSDPDPDFDFDFDFDIGAAADHFHPAKTVGAPDAEGPLAFQRRLWDK